jgi:hypothetical protein
MRMIVEQLVEWRLAGETEVLGENLPQRHFVHHKSHMARPGLEPRAAAVGSQRLTAWAMARPSWNVTPFRSQPIPSKSFPIHRLSFHVPIYIQARYRSNSMKPSPYWEANSCSATHGCPNIWRNPMVHCHVNKNPQLVPILSQINRTTYFSKPHLVLSYLLSLDLPCGLFPSTFCWNVI